MTYAGDYLPAAGDKVGDYLLLEPLGRGAMGQVYRAQDQTLGREAAIKFIDLSSLKNEKLIEEVKKRFLREARVLAAINHPNVVAIYTASLNFRCPYIAMEYFPGNPLFEFQDEFGVIDYKRCCLISLQICEALDYCWENYQVMHRDLKPANILIGDGGHIKIIDWGIAKVTKDLALGISLATRSDMRLGTPHFMAPEQQLNPSDVTYVADIYSMGVIMWQMLVGSPPFDANSEAVLYSQKIKGPTQKLGDLVPDLPPALEELIGRMMEPDPQKRISSYAEIRSILQREINKFEDISELFPKKKETQVPKLRPLPQFQGKRSPKKRYDGGTQPMEIQGLTRKEEEPTQAVSSPQKKLLIIKKPHETGPATPIPPKKVKLTKSGSIPATELSPPAAPAPPPKKVKLTKSGSIAVDPAQAQPGSPQAEPEAETVAPPPPASPQPASPQPPAISEPQRSPLSEALRSTASLRFQPLPDIRLINSK
ncbi:MAG: serine/threonine protein kinase, partial [Lentisphaerae bacterium]